MLRAVKTLLIAAVLVTAGAPAGLALDAREILARSDAVRNPQRPFRLVDTMTEYRAGRAIRQNRLVILSKTDPDTGQFNTLVRFAEPPRDRGKVVLKIGNYMWLYDPASKSSVRLSPRQRLMGQASNGDVVTVNFHLDYDARLEITETITDADRQRRTCYRLSLRAKNDTVTYFRIIYWVEIDSFFPVKGRFFSESDRLLKIAYYRRPQQQLGRLRPTEVLIIDGLDKSLVTRMQYGGYAYRDVPDHWFRRAFLPRLPVE